MLPEDNFDLYFAGFVGGVAELDPKQADSDRKKSGSTPSKKKKAKLK